MSLEREFEMRTWDTGPVTTRVTGAERGWGGWRVAARLGPVGPSGHLELPQGLVFLLEFAHPRVQHLYPPFQFLHVLFLFPSRFLGTYFVFYFSSDLLQTSFLTFGEGKSLWNGVALRNESPLLLLCQHHCKVKRISERVHHWINGSLRVRIARVPSAF